jgi:hypothetical protein
MKSRKILAITVMALALLVFGARVSVAAEMGTAFMYQGHLYDANYVADGLYDFQFALYDGNDPCTGSQVGSDVNKPDVDVIDGYFTVALDFNDANAFNGDARWLEISVRPGEMNDPNGYTPLSPLQEVTPAPYALRAESVSAPLELVASAAGGTAVLGVGSTGDGVAIGAQGKNGDIGMLGMSGVAVAGIAGSGGLAGSFTGDVDVTGNMDVDGSAIVDGNVGIGTTSPGAKLEVNGQVKITGGSPGAAKVLTSDASGLASWQTPAAGGDNLGNHIATQNIELNGHWLSGDGGNEGVYVNNPGNVGIGTTSPSEVLDVNGNININSVYKIGGATILSNTGIENIFAGEGAGASITAGYLNSAVGRKALYSNTGGNRNSAMGHEALYSNTTGNYNSAIGNEALYSNTTGNDNSAVGSHALYSNTTGTSNSAMGMMALYSNTTGNYNSAMGMMALYSNTDGNDNSAVGSRALYYNTTGNDNSAIGSWALLSNTTGNSNSAVGYGANYYNQEGSRNTIIGYKAGSGTTYHNKSGNVFIGYRAGYNEMGDNKLYIANGSADANVLIYGDFNTGRVGIGTTSPAGKLDVNGSIYQRGSSLHADYVFEDSYELESIEKHSESMWTNKHLPAMPKAAVDENGLEIVEVGSHRKGIVEELEKAHIYIEQVNNKNKSLEQRVTELENVISQLIGNQKGGL